MKMKAAAKSTRTVSKPRQTLRSTLKAARKAADTANAPPPPKRILAPVDFSSFSNRALQYAVSFADRFEAELLVVHVVEAFPIDYIIGIKSAKEANEWQVQQARSRLEHGLPKFVGDRADSIETIVRFGKPFQEIANVAKERSVDLIIIATHGYTGLKHIQLGSTAEMVVRYAACPVLVLPNPERAESAVERPRRLRLRAGSRDRAAS
jgi:nucleotide-binding universal stress UspA family protein